MVTTEDLSSIVKQYISAYDALRNEAWPYVSDHLPHSSLVSIDGEEGAFNIVTFNVFNYRSFGHYLSKLNTGFEDSLMLNPQWQEVREKKLLHYIDMMLQWGYVVCLQEVHEDFLLRIEELENVCIHANYRFDMRASQNLNVMVYPSHYRFGHLNPVNEYAQALRLSRDTVLVNVHVPYGGIKAFEDRLSFYADLHGWKHVIVAGDFNTPVFPQYNPDVPLITEVMKDFRFSVPRMGFTQRNQRCSVIDERHLLDCTDHICVRSVRIVAMQAGHDDMEKLLI